MANSGVSFSSPYQRQFKRASQEIIHDWTWTKGAHTLAWVFSFPGVSTTRRRYGTLPEASNLTAMSLDSTELIS
jgi:hypothetical protein